MGGLHTLISLVIDTSTNRTTVALFHRNELIFEGFHDGATAHAEALPKLVSQALAVENSINLVIVGMGPGPFTGLRVGIAFAQSFAQARNITWRGVCSLDGFDVDADEYIVTSDARRKEVYWAKYSNGVRTAGPQVSTPDYVAELPDKKFGFGFGDTIYPSPALLLAKAHTNPITEPMYLRRPDAVPTSERS
jgi:tRNA threonylcarbamoyladenosine biosynthesis protein TsaB